MVGPSQRSGMGNLGGGNRFGRGPTTWIWLLAVLCIVLVGTVLYLWVNRPRPGSVAADSVPAGEAAGIERREERVESREGKAIPEAVTATQPAATQPAPMVAAPATQPATQPALATPLRQGLALLEQGKLIEGRAALSALFFNHYADLDRQDVQAIRDTLCSINQDLVFGKKVTADDPLTEIYVVQPGDVLSKIAPRYKTTYQFIELINKVEARRIWAGQKLKVVKGPFHTVVHKSEFTMDVYLNDAAGKPVYVRSFPVGLGEEDSTPVGSWIVDPGNKVAHPGWTNPHTHKYYTANDPTNPIGQYWIGLAGADENTKGKIGYGIHGTIDPDSIGKMMSMGCVRMRNDDIALVYRLLVERLSTVQVVP